MRQMSLRQFAAHLATTAAHVPVGQVAGLKAAAEILEAEAKSLPGTYQPASAPFGRWADLKDSTIQDRISKGYPANEPLLREGVLRDSIHSRSDHREAVVGSDSAIAEYQEMGTKRIPPRPFLGMALAHKKDEAIAAVAAAVFAPLAGR